MIRAAILSLALLATGSARAAEQAAPPPYSCRLLYDEQRKCAFGSCDPHTLDRLKRECLRDGGRP